MSRRAPCFLGLLVIRIGDAGPLGDTDREWMSFTLRRRLTTYSHGNDAGMRSDSRASSAFAAVLIARAALN